MKKNSVKYLQCIRFLQLRLAEKAEIKNLCRATPDLVVCQSSSDRKQAHVRKLNPGICTKCKWL